MAKWDGPQWSLRLRSWDPRKMAECYGRFPPEVTRLSDAKVLPKEEQIWGISAEGADVSWDKRWFRNKQIMLWAALNESNNGFLKRKEIQNKISKAQLQRNCSEKWIFTLFCNKHLQLRSVIKFAAVSTRGYDCFDTSRHSKNIDMRVARKFSRVCM